MPVWVDVLISLFVSLLILALMLLSVWVTIDAARRGRNWVGWLWASTFFGVLAMFAWVIVRRRTPIVPDIARPTTLQLWCIALPVQLLMSFANEAIVTSYVQVARVEGRAMSPTLNDQDRLLVNKMVYQLEDPRRGEVVMIYYPLDPDKSFVKRVIAEPGDTIAINYGRVMINGAEVDEPYVAPESRSHDSMTQRMVDQGQYFVMGDRRNNSSDSRHWGLVPRKYVVGRIAYRWFPFNDLRSDFGTPSFVSTNTATR